MAGKKRLPRKIKRQQFVTLGPFSFELPKVVPVGASICIAILENMLAKKSTPVGDGPISKKEPDIIDTEAEILSSTIKK